MTFFNFIWYCITCMCKVFSATFGHINPNFNWKDGLVGITTIIVILLLIFAIIYILGFLHKNKFK